MTDGVRCGAVRWRHVRKKVSCKLPSRNCQWRPKALSAIVCSQDFRLRCKLKKFPALTLCLPRSPVYVNAARSVICITRPSASAQSDTSRDANLSISSYLKQFVPISPHSGHSAPLCSVSFRQVGGCAIRAGRADWQPETATASNTTSTVTPGRHRYRPLPISEARLAKKGHAD